MSLGVSNFKFLVTCTQFCMIVTLAYNCTNFLANFDHLLYDKYICVEQTYEMITQRLVQYVLPKALQQVQFGNYVASEVLERLIHHEEKPSAVFGSNDS